MKAYHSPTSDLVGHIDLVMKNIADQKEAEPSASVQTAQWLEIEVSRRFLVANEQEIRSKAKVPRLAKGLLKSLPSLELPLEGGLGTERCYAFKDPEDTGLRSCKLKMVMQTKLETDELKKDSSMFEQQPQYHYDHVLQEETKNMGMKGLLARDCHLQTFQDWALAKLNLGKADDDIMPGLEPEIVKKEADEECQLDHDSSEEPLEGVAAAAPAQKLQRSGSSSWGGKEKASTAGPGPSSLQAKQLRTSPTASEKKGGAAVAAARSVASSGMTGDDGNPSVYDWDWG